MNKEKVINFTGSLIIFFVLLFFYSKWGPSVPISVLTQTKGEPMVVSGKGKVTAVPDIAKVTVGVEENGPNLKQIQNSVDQKSKNLTDQLKKLGIDDKNIKTTNYNVFPEYDYSSSIQRITGYRVSTSHEVRITNFEKVNEVLTIATSAGANVVGGVSLEVNEATKDEKLQQARELAVKEAKEKAQGLARASGITLGRIINITESSGVDFPKPVAFDRAVGIGTEVATANIQPGESDIEVNVSLSFEVR